MSCPASVSLRPRAVKDVPLASGAQAVQGNGRVSRRARGGAESCVNAIAPHSGRPTPHFSREAAKPQRHGRPGRPPHRPRANAFFQLHRTRCPTEPRGLRRAGMPTDVTKKKSPCPAANGRSARENDFGPWCLRVNRTRGRPRRCDRPHRMTPLPGVLCAKRWSAARRRAVGKQGSRPRTSSPMAWARRPGWSAARGRRPRRRRRAAVSARLPRSTRAWRCPSMPGRRRAAAA